MGATIDSAAHRAHLWPNAVGIPATHFSLQSLFLRNDLRIDLKKYFHILVLLSLAFHTELHNPIESFYPFSCWQQLHHFPLSPASFSQHGYPSFPPSFTTRQPASFLWPNYHLLASCYCSTLLLALEFMRSLYLNSLSLPLKKNPQSVYAQALACTTCGPPPGHHPWINQMSAMPLC